MFYTVLRVSSWRFRARLALVVLMLVGQATAVIHASGEGMTVAEWFSPQTLLAIGSAVLAGGMMIQDLASLKRRVSDMDKTYATREAVQLQFQAVMAEVKTHFRPEFVNRIDEIVVFHPLGRSEIRRIVDIQIDGLRRRLAERELHLVLEEAALDRLGEALEAYHRAAELQPDNWRAFKGVGIVLDRMGYPAEAAEYYRRARDGQRG